MRKSWLVLGSSTALVGVCLLGMAAAGLTKPDLSETRRQAQDAEKTGYFGLAEKRWQAVCALAPDGTSRLHRDWCLANSGRIDEALSDARIVVRTEKGVNQSFASQVLSLCGDYPAAIASIDKALATKPGCCEYGLAKARIFYRWGRYDLCLAECRRLSGRCQGQELFDCQKLRLDALTAQGRYAEAEKVCRLLLLDQSKPALIRRLASLLDLQGRRPEALSLFKQMHKSSPDKGALLACQASWLVAHHLSDDAVVRELVKLPIADGDLFSVSALLGAHRQYRSQAMVLAQRLVRQSPGTAPNWTLLIGLAKAGGSSPELEKVLGLAQVQCPDKIAMAVERFKIDRGQTKGALSAAETDKIKNLRPVTDQDYAYRAGLYNGFAPVSPELRQLALSDCRTACLIGRAEDWLAVLLNLELLDACSSEAAARAIDRARVLVTVLPSAAHYARAGAAVEHFGENALARQYFKTALSLDPECCQAHFLLGRSYLKDNNLAQATRELAESVRLEPQDADAHRFAAQSYYLSNNAAAARRELAELDKLGQPLSWLHLRELAASILPNPKAAGETILSLGKEGVSQRIALVKKELTRAPAAERPDLHKQLADLYFFNRQWPQSIAECDAVIQSGHGDHRTYSRKAAAYHGWKKPQEARAIRQLAVEMFAAGK